MSADNVIDFTQWKSRSQSAYASTARIEVTTHTKFVAGIIYLFDGEGRLHAFDYDASYADFAVAGSHAMAMAQLAWLDPDDSGSFTLGNAEPDNHNGDEE